MTEDESIWVGADPGGKGKFGIALLFPDGTAHSWSVGCVDEAIMVIAKEMPSHPAGVGVDAPLWWSSGPSSDRMVDRWIRRNYDVGSSVQAANSLRGAAVVQGPMFVARIRELFRDTKITEAHPKALLAALELDWSGFAKEYSIWASPENEHERDAIISAVAAREGLEGRWTRDLSKERLASEQDPNKYWLKPVKYFWPD